jgi:hypothetical protein
MAQRCRDCAVEHSSTLPKHLKRERIEHDLPDSEKHCAECDQNLRRIGILPDSSTTGRSTE